MKTMLLAIAATTMSATVAMPAQAAVEIFSEDFESSANNGFGDLAAQGNVAVRSGTQLVAAFPGTTGSNTPTNPALTNRYAAFGFTNNTRPSGGTLLAATIQGVSNITRYRLTFDAGAFGTSPLTQYLSVSVTRPVGQGNFIVLDQEIDLNDPALTPTNLNGALKKFTFEFDATGPFSLNFFGEGERLDNSAVLLDNVNLSAVPETSTWIMMILGFGVVSSALRGHKRRAKLAVAA